MKRKFLLAVTLIVAVLGCLFAFVACEPAEHVHEFGAWENVTPATCTQEGKDERVCKLCSEKETRPVEKLAHTEVIDEAVEATCTQEGKTQGSHCSVCNTVLREQQTVEKLAHTEVIDEAVEATCTQEGKTQGSHCSVCNTVLKEQKTVEKIAHTEVIDEAVEATCTQEGKTQGSHCSICNTVLKEQKTVEKTAHTEVILPRVAPTCTEVGWTEGRQCSVCQTITVPQTEIAATNHDYDENWTVSTRGTHYRVCKNNPEHIEEKPCEYDEREVTVTCTTDGYVEKTCKFCHDKFEDEYITAPGHRDEVLAAVEANCAHPGKTEGTQCSVCGTITKEQKEIPIKADAHEWSAWSYVSSGEGNTHTRYCLNGCDTPAQTGSCEIKYNTVEPTCTTEGYSAIECTICHHYDERANVQEPLGHKWDDAVWKPDTGTAEGSETHSRICTRCGVEKQTKPCEFRIQRVVNPTCTDRGYTIQECKDCKTTKTTDPLPEKGHSFGAWTQVTGQNRHYQVCQNGCSTRNEEACELKTSRIEATCDTDGSVTTYCERCSNRTVQKLDRTGHDYTEVRHIVGTYQHEKICRNNPAHKVVEECQLERATIDPTCDEDGFTSLYCSTCHYAEDKTDIKPKLGHQYGSWQHTVEDGVDIHFQVCAHNNEHVIKALCSIEANTIEPTCDSEGYTHRACATCGFEEDVNRRARLQHVYPAYSSGNDGTHSATCSLCGHQDVQPCDYTDTVIQPTCTTPGITDRVCKVCSYQTTKDRKEALGHNWTSYRQYTGLKHLKVCSRDSSHTEEEECSITERIVPASCEAGGYTVNTCTKCAYSFNDDQKDALGHTYSDYYTYDRTRKQHYRLCTRDNHQEWTNCTFDQENVVKPTCLSSGYTEHTCSVCKGSYTDSHTEKLTHQWEAYTHGVSGDLDYHTRYCPLCKTKTPNTMCSFQTSMTDATCTEPAKKVLTCTVCQYVKTIEEKEALGHALGGDYISLKNGRHYRECSRCEEHVEEACNFVDASKAATCEDPGTINAKICSHCRYAEDGQDTKALGHSWKEGYTPSPTEYKHSRQCDRCGYVEFLDCGINRVTTPATCTTPESVQITCPDCKRDETVIGSPALGHTFETKEWVVTETNHKNTCDTCGESFDGGHDFEDSNLCDLCGYDGLIYEKGAGEFAVVASDERVPNAEKIIIPDVAIIEGHSFDVKEIAKYAFNQNKTITELVLHKNLKVIGEMAFGNCQNLRNVSMDLNGQAPQLVEIKDYAFQNCYSLREARFPTSLTTIGNYAFQLCTSLTVIELPQSVTNVGRDAFLRTGLVSQWEAGSDPALYISTHLIRVRPGLTGNYAITDGTLSVASYAFENCRSIDTLTIPASVKIFDRDACKNCEIKAIHYQGKFSEWMAIVFVNDASSPLGDNTTINLERAEGKIQIPAAATSIPAGTFRNSNITEVEFLTDEQNKSHVTMIGSEAFEGCSNLATIEFPDSVTYVGEDVFKDTLYYTQEVNWHDGVLYCGKHAIEGDNSKISEELELKTDTLSIAVGAFENCSKLKKVTIPHTVVYIGERAFVGTGLTSAVFTQKEDGTPYTFLAFMAQGAGRGVTYDPNKPNTDLTSESMAAQYLTRTYTGLWKRIQG